MTNYSTIFKKFTMIIKASSSHLSLTDEELEDIFSSYLGYACVHFSECEQDLEDRDDDLKVFNITLTNTEQWVLAHAMIICYLKPQLNYEDQMSIKISDRDHTVGSVANHIDKLIKLYDHSALEAERLMISYGFSEGSIGDLTK